MKIRWQHILLSTLGWLSLAGLIWLIILWGWQAVFLISLVIMASTYLFYRTGERYRSHRRRPW